MCQVMAGTDEKDVSVTVSAEIRYAVRIASLRGTAHEWPRRLASPPHAVTSQGQTAATRILRETPVDHARRFLGQIGSDIGDVRISLAAAHPRTLRTPLALLHCFGRWLVPAF